MATLRPAPVALALGMAALAAAVFFTAYGAVRSERMGLEPQTARDAAGVALFTCVILGPLPVAAVFILRVRRAVAENRVWQCRCVACAYPIEEGATACPECGRSVREPLAQSPDRHLGRWYAALVLLGCAAGLAAAETLMLLDEARFRREAQAAVAGGAPQFSRPRAWPHGGSDLWFIPGRGYEVVQ